MNDSLERLITSIKLSYSEQKSAEKIVNILNKIRKGGSYKDIYEYARTIGLGDKLKQIIDVHDWLDNREHYEEVSQALFDTMKEYSNDINDLAEIVQKAINDKMGINIAPQRVNVQNERITSIVEGAIGENGNLLNLEKEILTFSSRLTDEIIQRNADIQSKSGFDVVVIRRYDEKGLHNYANYADKAHRHKSHPIDKCLFCTDSKRLGTFNYDDVKQTGHPVWQRHKGCTCSIDYVNNGITERVKNYRRNIKENEEIITHDVEKEIADKKYQYLDDVTREYELNAIDKKKSLKVDPRADIRDVQTAQWYLDKYKGDVHVLEEINEQNEKNPDAIIDGLYWEFKAPSNLDRADDRLRKAWKQITAAQERENKVGDRAGIIIDVTNIELPEKELIPEIGRLFSKRIKGQADVVIKKGNNTLAILRK